MTYLFEDFALDEERFCLERAGRRVQLEPKSLRVLTVLVRARGRLVSKSQLLEEVWSGTFVDETTLTRAIALLRKHLGDDRRQPRFIETVPTLGYRFVASVADHIELAPPITNVSTVAAESKEQPFDTSTRQDGEKPESTTTPTFTEGLKSTWRAARSKWALVLVALVIIILGALGIGLLSRRAGLRPRDTIVLADFINTTGDMDFDDTLRQGLAVELEQTPSFRILPDANIKQTLQMMDLNPDTRLSPETAREVCIRSGAEVVIEGRIAKLGGEYILTLRAANCSDNELLASAKAEVSNKSKVLAGLGQASSQIRRGLGESIASIRRFDTTLQEATTSSLEALKIYSAVNQGHASGDPFLLMQHAIELDPKFAVAYSSVANGYANIGEAELSSQFAQKAYDNREHATERDRFRISASYYYATLGDLEQELRVYPVWEQMFPRDYDPWNDSAATKAQLGDYDGALAESLIALRLGPDQAQPYINASSVLLDLNRTDEATQTAKRALARGVDVPDLHIVLYRAAFLQKNKQEMAAQLRSLKTSEGYRLSLESNTQAYFGCLKSAKKLSASELQFAQDNHLNETSALIKGDDGLVEAELGLPERAEEDAEEAMTLSSGRHAKVRAALVLALAGDVNRAQKLSDDLAMSYRSDTMLQTYWLPTILGSIALAKRNPLKALEALQHVPYELGDTGTLVDSMGNLMPIYLRGQAYLERRQGKEAATEFRKIVAHSGIVFNSPLGSLAHLGLGRAYLRQGDTTNAKLAYQEFLSLWKDADDDIPVLREARSEYAKLQ